MYLCDNCDRVYEKKTDLRYAFPNIPDLLRRIEPGGVVPEGECPWCGAFVYRREDRNPRVLEAMEHALERLNAIPHPYAETDFRLIEDALADARRDATRDAQPLRLLILLNGGLVQAVCTTRPGIEAAVLDQDTEGADDSEISAIEGEVDTLYGHLSRPAVSDGRELIDSAWRTLDADQG